MVRTATNVCPQGGWCEQDAFLSEQYAPSPPCRSSDTLRDFGGPRQYGVGPRTPHGSRGGGVLGFPRGDRPVAWDCCLPHQGCGAGGRLGPLVSAAPAADEAVLPRQLLRFSFIFLIFRVHRFFRTKQVKSYVSIIDDPAPQSFP